MGRLRSDAGRIKRPWSDGYPCPGSSGESCIFFLFFYNDFFFEQQQYDICF